MKKLVVLCALCVLYVFSFGQSCSSITLHDPSVHASASAEATIIAPVAVEKLPKALKFFGGENVICAILVCDSVFQKDSVSAVISKNQKIFFKRNRGVLFNFYFDSTPKKETVMLIHE